MAAQGTELVCSIFALQLHSHCMYFMTFVGIQTIHQLLKAFVFSLVLEPQQRAQLSRVMTVLFIIECIKHLFTSLPTLMRDIVCRI
jgi:hypothetical protein